MARFTSKPNTEHDLQPASSFHSEIFLGKSCRFLRRNASTDGNYWTSQDFRHAIWPSDEGAHENKPDEPGSAIALSNISLWDIRLFCCAVALGSLG